MTGIGIEMVTKRKLTAYLQSYGTMTLLIVGDIMMNKEAEITTLLHTSREKTLAYQHKGENCVSSL